MTEESTLNIHQRLHRAMCEVDYIQKEKKQGMRYTIVSHDAVTAKVRPALVQHGIVYYPVAMNRRQDGNRTEIDLTVRFANIDDPADHIDVVSAGYGVDEQDKGPGKAISYAVKYALLKALGLETGDDPDETQDERATHKPAAAAPSPGKTMEERRAERTAVEAFKVAIGTAQSAADLADWGLAHQSEISKMDPAQQTEIRKAYGDRLKHLKALSEPTPAGAHP